MSLTNNHNFKITYVTKVRYVYLFDAAILIHPFISKFEMELIRLVRTYWILTEYESYSTTQHVNVPVADPP